jgi:hypothetical protein
MFNLLLVAFGLAIFIYSAIKLISLLELISVKSLKKWWTVLLGLILLFCAGYIAFGYFLLSGDKNTTVNPMFNLVSFIFFFGAIFVLVAISLIYQTVKKLEKEKYEINEVNAQFKKTTDSLKKAETSLSDMNSILKQKVSELEQMNSLMVGRELKMIELKKENEELRKGK